MLEMLPPFALRVAATLRLSDHIAAGYDRLPELARAAGADPDALGRLLRYLVLLNVYREPEPGTFAVTPAGRMLSDAHPASLRTWLDLDGPGGRMDLALGGLLHAVRTGEPGFPAVFGHSFWDDLAERPGRQQTFDSLMAGKSTRVITDLVAEPGWADATHVVDVGGGNGSTLIALLTAHPHLRGTLVDLPGPAERARAAAAEAGLSDRFSVVGGSFLDGVPEGGDVYLLFDILHDWDDTTARAILGGCARACAPGGRVLVVEELPAGPADVVGAAMDLKMLTLFAGRQRDAGALAGLADEVGLRADDGVRLRSGFSVVTCQTVLARTATPRTATPRTVTAVEVAR